jgi:subtilisin family serine protease
MKKNQLQKMFLSLCAMGVLFTSCEKEDVNESLDVDAVELNEPSFTNYLVITESGEQTKSVENFLKTGGGEIVSSIPEIGISIVNSKDANFIQNTMKNRDVTSVVPDYEIAWIPREVKEELEPSIGDDETYYFYQWNFPAIDAPQAWNAGFTGKGASVYVLDSGVSGTHPDLVNNINTELSRSFITGQGWHAAAGTSSHGTHVAGTIAAADNGMGVIGVAPNAEIVAVKVLSGLTGSGPFSAISAGIVYSGSQGADVINMSLGTTLNKNGKLVDANGVPYKIPAKYVMELVNAQQRAVDYAFKQGSTLIASAGNDPTNYDGNSAYIKLPGGLNNIITVSATSPVGWNYETNPVTNFDVPTSYTTHGKSLIDVAAPGGDVNFQLPDGYYSGLDRVLSTTVSGWGWMAGTSMAAPHVSGVAALIIAKNGGKMSPHEVTEQIVNTADKVGGNGNHVYYGKGRVNAYRAVTE